MISFPTARAGRRRRAAAGATGAHTGPPAVAGATPRWLDRPAFLVTLTVLAAWVDALSFLRLGKVFTSFMSGNWLCLGIGAGTGAGGLVLRAGVALAAFVAGGAVGVRLVGARLSPAGSTAASRRGLVLEAALLIAFAAVWIAGGDATPAAGARLALLALAGGAMGVQAALSLALEIPNVATVALTASFAQLARIAGLGPRGWATEAPGQPGAALLLGLCLCYLLTALVVALLPAAPVLAAVPLGLLAVAAAARGAR
jgi:uncharacterized membrane protein YoaK (UPF0700 family)